MGGLHLLRGRDAAREPGGSTKWHAWQACPEVCDVVSCVGQSVILVGWADKLAIVPTCLNEARCENRGVLDGQCIRVTTHSPNRVSNTQGHKATHKVNY